MDNIHVAVRMRPLISREKESKAGIYWKANGSTIHQANAPDVQFNFDRVFTGIDTNDIVYQEFCAHLVKSVINGFNGTIFAYGQTSSGKTFTMMGNDDGKNLGIMHYTISDIFNYIQDMPDREFLLRVSYMEIYNEMVVDLLTDKNEPLKLKEDKYGHIKVNGLTEHIVQEANQVLELMRKGEKKRSVGSTLMNKESSRSHSIFQVIIESGIRGDEDAAVNVSHFNLVDLAGSERVRQTGAKGARLKESININKSLSTLSQVISQLSERVAVDQYINYRDSKLTRILQNSLGGNARTAIICTVTPASLEETHSTLKFATRAKSIKNKPQVNEVLTEQALLKRYANEIKQLTKELEATKEEKAQQNKHLQEQILALRNKFVFQMGPSSKKSARRETWGGSMDAARLGLSFAPRTFSAPMDVDSENVASQRKSFTSSNQVSAREPTRKVAGLWKNPLLDLQTVDEENELDLNLYDTVFQSRHSKSEFNSVAVYSDATVQTDMRLQSPAAKTGSPKSDEIKRLYTLVKSLEDELADAREFTTLEKQIMRERNRLSLGLNDDSPRPQVQEQTRRILLTENGTPQKSGSRFSIEDESTLFENESYLVTNHSSTPLQSSSVANNGNVSILRDIKLDQHASHMEVIEEGNSPDGEINLENEKLNNEKELFLYLGDTIKILSGRTEISFASKTDKLNEQYKVLLSMFNMVLHYQCSKLDTNFIDNLSVQISEISNNLNEVLCRFADQSVSPKDIEDMIENFMNKTNDLLKEIEMLSLDMGCLKKSTGTLMPLGNADEMDCFEVSDIVHTTRNPEVFCSKICVDNAVNTTLDYPLALAKSPEHSLIKSLIDSAVNTSIDYSQTTKDNIDMHNIALFKSQIASLENDIETHLKTISELKEDLELKNEQVASFEDEMLIQNEIIDCLKEELAVKGIEKPLHENTCQMMDDSCQTSYLEDKNTASENVSSCDLKFTDCSSQTYWEDGEETNKASLIKYQKLLEETEHENKLLHTKITTLEKEIKNVKEANKASLIQYQKVLEEYEHKNKLLHTKVTTLEREMEDVKEATKASVIQYQKVQEESEHENKLLHTKIIALEKEIESRGKTISKLNQDKDIKDLRVNVLNDKVEIQEQIIESLNKELSLNLTGNNSKAEPDGVCSCRRIPVSLVDSSSQTFFMEKLLDYCPEEITDECDEIEPMIVTNNPMQEKRSANKSFDEAFSIKSTDMKSSDLPLIESVDQTDRFNTQTSLGATFNELKELKEFMLDFMERHVPKEYYEEVISSCENKEGSSVQDIKVGVNILKEMLKRLEFYLKNKLESYEHFQNVLENKAAELLSLQGKFSSVQSKLQKSEVDDRNLDEALSDLEKVWSAFIEKFKAPTDLTWIDPASYTSKASKRVLILQKLNQTFNYFMSEKNLLLKGVEKVTKDVQTDEDVVLSKVYADLDELKAENNNLVNDVNHLKSRIEKANKVKESMECKYKEKEMSYKKEIENMQSKFELERSSLTAKTLECVKTVENKCDQMLIDQENKFYDELDKANLQHRKDMKAKAEFHDAEVKRIVSEHECKIAVFKNEHLKEVADIERKLSELMRERSAERTKLESEINKLRKDVLMRTDMCSKIKQKYKDHIAEMQRRAAKTEKPTKDCGLQTDVLPSLKKEVKTLANKETQLTAVEFQKKFMVECDFCDQCSLILQSCLQKQESNQVQADNVCCRRLQNELETKTAKVISLTRNNEKLVQETVELNKDLAAKLMLLRNCQCRQAPRTWKSDPNRQETSEKKKESHPRTQKNEAATSSETRKELVFSNEREVLTSDLVQRAIDTAVEEDRMKLGDTGTASVMANCLLKRKMNLQEKEMKRMRKEIAELKTTRKYADKGNENRPIKGTYFDEYEITSYTQSKHPYPLGTVPKLQPKQTLKERNRASQPAGVPLTAKVEKKDPLCEIPPPLNPYSADLNKPLDSNRGKKDLVEKTKRELEMVEPECKQQ